MSKKPPSTMTPEEEVLSRISLTRMPDGSGRTNVFEPHNLLRASEKALSHTIERVPYGISSKVQSPVSIKPEDTSTKAAYKKSPLSREVINPDALDSGGKTQLHHAVIEGNLDAVQKLYEKGANFDSKDKEGYAPIHYAASSGNLGLLQNLFEKGANLNEVDRQGNTVAHYFASHDDTEGIRQLAELGAKFDIVNNRRMTPLALARTPDAIKAIKVARKPKSVTPALGSLAGKKRGAGESHPLDPSLSADNYKNALLKKARPEQLSGTFPSVRALSKERGRG